MLCTVGQGNILRRTRRSQIVMDHKRRTLHHLLSDDSETDPDATEEHVESIGHKISTTTADDEFGFATKPILQLPSI